jgi:hypothetical protein
MDLYIHFPIRLHDVMLNQISIGTDLPFTFYSKKGFVIKYMVFKRMNSRCLMGLIDIQSQVDGEFKFIIVH